MIIAPAGELITTEQALDALTDAALFITVYVSLVATLAGIEKPQTKGEMVARAIAYWMCAVGGVIMLVWLVFALLIRIGIIAAIHG